MTANDNVPRGAAVANQNIHRVGGSDILDRPDERFREYRRQWRENPSTGTVAPFPLFLDIEVTSVCNLRCPFCATTFRGAKVKKGFLGYALFQKIIDEGVAHGLYGAKFNIRGEPLLHPDIVRMVRYAKQQGLVDVYFNTNALLLTPELSEQLIDAGLDRISVSIEGYTAAVYEKYRVPGKFADLLRNLEGFLAARERAGRVAPRLRIQSVLIPELLDDLESYGNFWQQYADEVAYLDYKEMKEKKSGIVSSWVCPQIWQRMAIFWDGTVLPCNHDDDARLALGNVAEKSIRDCWASKRVTELRDCHRRGEAHTIPACDGCYLRDSETAKLTKQKG